MARARVSNVCSLHLCAYWGLWFKSLWTLLHGEGASLSYPSSINTSLVVYFACLQTPLLVLSYLPYVAAWCFISGGWQIKTRGNHYSYILTDQKAQARWYDTHVCRWQGWMRQSGLTRVPSLTLRDWLVFFLATQKHGVSTGSSLIYNYEEWGGWVSILSFCSRPLAVQCRIAFSRLLVAHRRTWGSCKWHIL